MLCEKILGNIKDKNYDEYIIDYVDIEWFEAFKKLHKKKTTLGNEIGIRLGEEVLTKGIKDGSILYEDNNMIVVVNIPQCDVIKVTIDKNHSNMLGKVCYEIGNRHSTLFWGENDNELIIPFNKQILEMLNKIHGIYTEVIKIKLDFDKSISATINNHVH